MSGCGISPEDERRVRQGIADLHRRAREADAWVPKELDGWRIRNHFIGPDVLVLRGVPPAREGDADPRPIDLADQPREGLDPVAALNELRAVIGRWERYWAWEPVAREQLAAFLPEGWERADVDPEAYFPPAVGARYRRPRPQGEGAWDEGSAALHDPVRERVHTAEIRAHLAAGVATHRTSYECPRELLPEALDHLARWWAARDAWAGWDAPRGYVGGGDGIVRRT